MCLCVNNNLQKKTKKKQQQLNTTTRTSLNFFCFYFKFFFCRHDSFDLWPSIFNTDANRSEDQKKNKTKISVKSPLMIILHSNMCLFFTLLCYIIKDSCCEASVCVCMWTNESIQNIVKKKQGDCKSLSSSSHWFNGNFVLLTKKKMFIAGYWCFYWTNAMMMMMMTHTRILNSIEQITGSQSVILNKYISNMHKEWVS